MRITYIAEGSKESGIGHIMDIANWANELRNKAIQSDKDIMIFNGPSVSVDEIRYVRSITYPNRVSNGIKIVTCYNNSPANDWADVVVCPTVQRPSLNTRKRYLKPYRRVVFSGPKYRILRPEFYQYRGHHVQRKNVEAVLIMFGGTDAAGFADRVGQLLYKDYELIYAQGRNDIAELLCEVDVALVSPGFALWEALCIGCPVIVVPQNAQQEKSYGKDFPLVGPKRIEDIPSLIRLKQFVYPEPEYQIGTGKDELIEAILS